MPKHVQKELLKVNGIEFQGNIIIIEEAASTRIKIQDEQKTELCPTHREVQQKL